jgi:hypothetical protein
MRSLFLRSIPAAGLVFLAACQDRQSDLSGPAPDGRVPAVTNYPSLVGSYSGTAAAVLKTSIGVTQNISCTMTANVGTQPDSSFSGTFSVTTPGDCGTYGAISGALTGTVGVDGGVTVTADTPDPGANIFEDTASRTGCTLVSTTGTLSGSFASGRLSGFGSAVYECPSDFGTVRVTADLTVSLTRS